MKRKIFPILLSIFLLFQVTPVAFAAASAPIEITFTRSSYTIGSNTTTGTAVVSLTSKTSGYTTIKSILSDLSDGVLKTTGGTITYVVDKTAPLTIKIPQTSMYTEEITDKVIIAGVSDDTSDDSAEIAESGDSTETNNEIRIAYSGDITIQATYNAKYNYENMITFSGGLEVQSGATLILDNNTQNQASQSTIKYVFKDDVVVSGKIEFNGNTEGTGTSGGTSGPVTFSDGATMIVKDGGEVNLVSVAVSATSTDETSTNDPLITVEQGGQLTSTSANTSYPTVTYAGTAILVKNGASLNLTAGQVTSTTSDPAVKVESGGTVTLTETGLYMPEVTAPQVTTSNGGVDAIDLAAGATVGIDAQTVVVSEDSKTGESYVDNYGNLILPAGGTTPSNEDDSSEGTTIAANTVIAKDGTIVTGTTTIPTISQEGDVQIPEGGATVSVGNTTIVVKDKGAIEQLYFVCNAASSEVPTAQDSATILTNDTISLSLKSLDNSIHLDEYTTTWSSSNENIATVDTSGLVTGKSVGTAMITAKLTPKSNDSSGDAQAPRGSDGIATVSDDEEENETEGVITAKFTVTVTSNGSSSSSSSRPSYSITAPSDVDNGSVTVSSKSAKRGATVTITATPTEGYELSSLTVTDASGNQLTLTDKGDGKYIFVMPSSKVSIDAVFTAVVPPTPPVCDGGKDCPAYHLTDVDPTQWYHEGVDYVVSHGMMVGVTPTTFAPDATTTRGMIVTILYRLEGSPAVTAANPFTDVAADQWYGNAVIWAAENGVVTGDTPTTFSPDDPITREQMAAILYRYAALKGYDITEKADLSGYTDAATISGYAETAMDWANAEGLITGTTPSTLAPQGNALRAQVAAILMRFCQNVAQ